jgi:protocatechuate 4,5-dioxygenase alpha chain
MNSQLRGIEQLPGTYVFDVRVSNQTLRLNRFFWNLTRPSFRSTFRDSESDAMLVAGLSDEERDLVTARDWIGLIRYGANFFALEKFARLAGMSNLEVYASMRGESFEDFMKTRNVPGAR